MVDRSARGTGILATAAVVAGVTAVALVVLGFWLRDWVRPGDGTHFTDPRWWVGVVSHIGGYLALGKVGFKVALAVVLGASGLVVLMRQRRRERLEAAAETPEASTDEPS
ncbi:hypothetical protein [Phytohabitans suffuscus]|uniref:Uncharacterized protein n=1 Tax=Phytohabitans suffuscus TaxID=624315 RepID=A0A6F8YDN2_9ACTN|nr:hypothetical protein [Phytohabitans suffuscus]BCB84170.1 hypothetical protein Psuf_014830 [Phytohabitans suffuscus]